MKELNGIKVKYSSPAVTPKDIKLGTIYTLVINKKEVYIKNNDFKKEMPLGLIKQMFTPVDGDWDEIIKEEVEYLNI